MTATEAQHRRPRPASCRAVCRAARRSCCRARRPRAAAPAGRRGTAARPGRPGPASVWAGGSSSPPRSSARTRARSAAQVVLSRPSSTASGSISRRRTDVRTMPSSGQSRSTAGRPTRSSNAFVASLSLRVIIRSSSSPTGSRVTDVSAASGPLPPTRRSPSRTGSPSPSSPRATCRSTATRTGTLTVLAAGTTRLPPMSASTPVGSATTTRDVPGRRGDQVGQRPGEVGQGPGR